MRFYADVHKDELIDNIANELSIEEIITLIKDIDSKVADWGFTIELRDYFKKLAEDDFEDDVEGGCL